MRKTRKEAKGVGDRYYSTGKVCKNGHVDKRFTHNGACYTCVQQASSKSYHSKRNDISGRKEQILTRVKQRANREGIEFTLSVDTVTWNTHCPVFGYELDYHGGDFDRLVSLDKDDPNGGYTPDNVVVMSNRANRAKWNMTKEEVRKLYEYFYVGL